MSPLACLFGLLVLARWLVRIDIVECLHQPRRPYNVSFWDPQVFRVRISQPFEKSQLSIMNFAIEDFLDFIFIRPSTTMGGGAGTSLLFVLSQGSSNET